MYFHPLRRRAITALCLLALGGLVCGGTAVLAQNKGGGKGGGGGGGGGGDTGGGTIYFQWNGVLHQMNSDGSGKTPLSTPAGEPSRLLHAGHRWFLRLVSITGETHPNRWPKEEVVAYRDDGEAVQVTDDPDLQQWNVRWLPGDNAISWVGQRWDSETEEVVEAGVYGALLDYDEFGDLAGIVPGSITLLLPESDIGSHDWSPDGTRIVYDLQATKELWTADMLVSEVELLYVGPAGGPRWSPDGSLIAFGEAVYRGDIMTIKPDGTNLKRIIRATGNSKAAEWVSRPSWSPTGSHLVYEVWSHDGFDASYADVYRAKADGSGKTNLTNESKTDFARPLGWR